MPKQKQVIDLIKKSVFLKSDQKEELIAMADDTMPEEVLDYLVSVFEEEKRGISDAILKIPPQERKEFLGKLKKFNRSEMGTVESQVSKRSCKNFV
jgi:hypothetical protein